MKSEADAGSAELDSTADDSSEQEVMDLYGSVDQMLSEIEDEDEGDADPEAEGTEDGDEPSDEDEGDEPESVQPAATTAADAKIERLEAQIGSLTAAIEGLLKAQAEKPAPKPVPVEDTEEPPEGATARELVSFYAKQAAREEARKTVDEGMAPLRPALEQRKFLDTMASSYEALLTAGGVSAGRDHRERRGPPRHRPPESEAGSEARLSLCAGSTGEGSRTEASRRNRNLGPSLSREWVISRQSPGSLRAGHRERRPGRSEARSVKE
jgi:hypothetical protein